MANKYLLDGVIRLGLDYMRQTDLQEYQYNSWLDYSRSILCMISSNPLLMANYMNVVLAASNQNLKPVQRLSMCLRYLIEIQSVI